MRASKIKTGDIGIECPSCLKEFDYEIEYFEEHYSIISPVEICYSTRFVECEECGEVIYL